MKKSIIYISALLMSIGPSCDLLDKQPLDQLATETFWKTESDVELALTSCYSGLNNTLMSWGLATLDGLSDDLYHQHGYAGIRTISQGVLEPTSGGVVTEIWKYGYEGIAKCNFFLNGIENVPIDETKRNAYKAEALFLRANYYFNLTEFYGDVPLYLKTPTVEEAQNYGA